MNEATPEIIYGVKFRFTGSEIQAVLRYSVEELRKDEAQAATESTTTPVAGSHHKAEKHADENEAKIEIMNMMIQRIIPSAVYYLTTEEAKEFNLFPILAFLNKGRSSAG